MFCVLRILLGCVFRSQPDSGLPGALPYQSDALGNCQPQKSIVRRYAWAGGMCVGVTVFAQRTCSIILFYLVIAALMVWVGGKVHTVRKFLMAMGIFLGGNFLMGGFLSVLPYKARKNAFSFLAITITAYWMLYIGIRLCKYLKGKELPICEVVVTFQGKEMTIKGLYDTGNCLRDQETGKSVAVMDYSGFCRLLSQEQCRGLEHFCSMETEELEGEREFASSASSVFALYQCRLPGWAACQSLL